MGKREVTISKSEGRRKKFKYRRREKRMGLTQVRFAIFVSFVQ